MSIKNISNSLVYLSLGIAFTGATIFIIHRVMRCWEKKQAPVQPRPLIHQPRPPIQRIVVKIDPPSKFSLQPEGRDILVVWQVLGQKIRVDIPSCEDFTSNEEVVSRFCQWINDHIKALEGISDLPLSRYKLTHVPEAIGRLTGLQKLDLSNNQLTQISDTLFFRLTALKELSFIYNQLTEIPAGITRLTGLELLGFNENQLTEIPAGISRLTALQKLYLTNNRLTRLPESIGGLTGLQELSLSSNQLTQIPHAIGRLTALRELFFHYNRLDQVPEVISRLTALRVLDLSHNLLTTLPRSLSMLPRGCNINAENNRIGEAQNRAFADASVQGPGYRYSIYEGSRPAAATSFEETLTFWLKLFKETFPQANKRDTLFYQPLSIHPKKALLVTFLSMLKNTKDFKDKRTRTNVILRVGHMLEGASIHEQFRDKIFLIIEDSLSSCTDRVDHAFIQIEILWNIHCKSTTLTDRQLVELILGMRRFDLLNKIAEEKIAELRLGDPIEVYLCLLIRLRETLKLPFSTEGMLYGSGMSAELLLTVLEDAKKRILSQTTSAEDVCQVLAQSELWQEKLKAAHPREFEAINSDVVTQMLGSDPLLGVLIAQQKVRMQNLVLTLTRDWIRRSTLLEYSSRK